MRNGISWQEARDLLLSLTEATEEETLPLPECAGRVLAMDLEAAQDVPPFDRSAYDGYALRAEDVEKASETAPVTLRITETVPAGKVPLLEVTRGTAAHVMTGVKIPTGADCVIDFESTSFTRDTVTLTRPLKRGANIVRQGEDVRKGTLLAPKGTMIDAFLAGALASQGVSRVPVYRRPVIGLISTGSEVVEAGSPEAPGKIRNASRAAFEALLIREGCAACYLGLAGDDAGEIAGLITRGLTECDAVLLTGGVSVGDWDVTPEAMTLAGAELLVRGVAMKPGMACAYGTARGKLVLGLSGNPASALTNYCACVLPAVRKLGGRKDVLPVPFRAVLKDGFKKKSPSERLLRGKLTLSDGVVRFEASAAQGNAVLSSAVGCGAFAVIPAGSGPLEAGESLHGFML